MPKKGSLKAKSLRRRLARTQRQRARNLLSHLRSQKEQKRQSFIQRSRRNKENQRALEVAENNNILHNNYSNLNNLENLRSIGLNELYNMENKEFQESEKEEINKAIQRMENAQKERFYIRVDGKTMYKASELLELLNDRSFYFDTLEILYLSDLPELSYYYKFYYDDEYEENNYYSNNGHHPVYRTFRYISIDVRQIEPFEYFRNELNANDPINMGYENRKGITIATIISWPELRQYILLLRNFRAKVQAERTAKITVPRKLESLHTKALQGTIGKFERNSGSHVPRELQNVIESYMLERQPPQVYFEQRDNLQRINTGLFQG